MLSPNIFRYINSGNLKNAFFHIKTYGLRSVVRKTADYLEFTKTYNDWRLSHIVSSDVLEQQKHHDFANNPLISIIVPVYKTPAKFLRQMIDSVINQTYSHWELCIADGSADVSADYIEDIISDYQRTYPNIRYQKLSANLGISGNTNAALDMASGDFIALLDHDDVLTLDALYEIVQMYNENTRYDVFYTDEDKVNTDFTSYYDPYFKPDFNLDLLRSCNYITHFFVVKASLAKGVGGFSDQCNGSQDYDFILKTCEKATAICHIPKILYHWRIHSASVAGDPESKLYAYESAVRALQNHLDRCNENAVAMRDLQYGYYRTEYHYNGTPLVSIILQNCSSDLESQIRSITTYSNYEIVSSVSDASGEFVLFLSHTQKILSRDWIEQLLGNCSRSNVGICGGKIFYRRGKVLSYGLVYTSDGQLHSPFYRLNDLDTGYCYRARIQQCCSIIEPYCFMTKRSLLEKMWPAISDSDFENQFYDYCHQMREQNYNITILPNVSVLCSSTGDTLPAFPYYARKTDPFYNPNFSSSKMYHLS